MLAKAWDTDRLRPGGEPVRRLKGVAHRTRSMRRHRSGGSRPTGCPDLGVQGSTRRRFALDVGIAHDTPGTEGEEKLGGARSSSCTTRPRFRIAACSTWSSRRRRSSGCRWAVRIGRTRRHRCGRIQSRGRAVPGISSALRRATSTSVSIIARRDFDQTVQCWSRVQRRDQKTVAT